MKKNILFAVGTGIGAVAAGVGGYFLCKKAVKESGTLKKTLYGTATVLAAATVGAAAVATVGFADGADDGLETDNEGFDIMIDSNEGEIDLDVNINIGELEDDTLESIEEIEEIADELSSEE